MFQPKTLTQIKEDLVKCTINEWHPMEMTRIEDVRRACDLLKNLESDHWCEVWSQIAKPFEDEGQAKEKAGQSDEAELSYMLAYNYYRMARFPVPNTPAKKKAYRSSVDNYLKASRYFNPPLEKVVIPFAGKKGEGKEIITYLRKPKGVARPPVLINHAGVDVFKEEQILMEPAFWERGIATLSMDMAGTGESPLLGSVDAERVYDPILTYLQNRNDLDGSRVGLMGMSFGGYWATKMAHTDKRLSAAVCWGGGAHQTFQKEWQHQCRYAPTHLGNEDLIITRSNAFGIVNDFEAWLEYVPKLSLLTQGILDKPCVPLLIVNGKDDAHVPLADAYLLLEHGSPKTVRLFPGGHMGMTPQTLPTIADWVAKQLKK